MQIETKDNITQITLESPEAFSAFRMGMTKEPGAIRNWQRHPETQELNNYVADKRRQEYIYVSYGDATVRVK